MTGDSPTQQLYAIGKAAAPPPPAAAPSAWAYPPGPPPRPRRTGRIAGAAVGVGLFVVLAVTGAIAIRSLGTAGDQPAAQAPIAQAPIAQAPASGPATATPGSAPAAPVSGGSPHRFVANLCTMVDLSPAFGILPASGAPNVVEQPGAVEWNAACSYSLTDGVSDGRLLLTAVGGDPAAIQSGYQASVQAAPSANRTVEQVTGAWQAGVIGIGNFLDEAAVDLLVLDGNLRVEVVLAVNRGPAPAIETMRAAVVRIAQDVLAETSQV